MERQERQQKHDFWNIIIVPKQTYPLFPKEVSFYGVWDDFLRPSKQGRKDQESIQSSTTPDPGYQWESDKLTEDTTNESQEVSPFPAGDHEAHINRRAQNIANARQNKNIKDPQKKYRLGTVSKIFYWRV